MEFVWIAPGTFLMGSPSAEPGRYSDEGPQHQVTLSRGFWLGKHEITQGQWEAATGTAPWSGQGYVQANPQHPAVYVSWVEVQKLVVGLNKSAEAGVYRLPSEAEWEYACRAGTTTRWSFGDDEGKLCGYAWYDADRPDHGLQYAQAVGTKRRNPWGLYDMHGNIWEWVQDWWGSYPSGVQTNPVGPSAGSSRVFRGGDFSRGAQNARSAYRGGYSPHTPSVYVGARLLRTE